MAVPPPPPPPVHLHCVISLCSHTLELLNILTCLKATPIIHCIVNTSFVRLVCVCLVVYAMSSKQLPLLMCPQPGPNTFWYCQVTIIFSSPQQLLHLVQSFPLCNCSNPNSDPECLMVWEVFTCMISMSIQVQDLFSRSNLLLNYCEISRIKLYASLLFYIEMRCRT